MNYFSWIILVTLLTVFIKRYFYFFDRIQMYDTNNGFQNSTVCYIKHPFSSSVLTKITHRIVSKIIIKSIFLTLFIVAILSVFITKLPWIGIAVVAVDYILLRIWYRVYSAASGVKLLEHGVAKGVQVIPWKSIKKYQLKHSLFNRKESESILWLNLEDKWIPTLIEITNQNNSLLEKYLNENCVKKTVLEN